HSFDPASDEGLATFRMSDDWKNETGTAWYRLRLVAEDGRTFFSPSVAITCFEQGSNTTYLFPHSLIFGAAVALDLREKAPVSIAITDEKGEVLRMVYESEGFAGRKLVEINLDGLAKGNYICRIMAGTSVTTRVITR
ncbi:MAG: T9SS C-terminal target domain-containing protein, partial [Bacteroidetes bacterium]